MLIILHETNPETFRLTHVYSYMYASVKIS